MQLELVTAPLALPVEVDEFRRQAWEVYDQDAEDDTYLEELLLAATAHVETITSRRLVAQTWRGYLDAWPAGGGPIELPFGRVTAITRFNWLGADAVDHTLVAGTDYAASLVGWWPKVVPLAGWPGGSLFVVDPIRIEFVAGFGAPAAVPADLKRAILQLAAHWYKNREIVRVGNMVSPLPTVFDALVAPWRIRHV
jgi:uncharacterized phiE125 gp8 family phage protein